MLSGPIKSFCLQETVLLVHITRLANSDRILRHYPKITPTNTGTEPTQQIFRYKCTLDGNKFTSSFNWRMRRLVIVMTVATPNMFKRTGLDVHFV